MTKLLLCLAAAFAIFSLWAEADDKLQLQEVQYWIDDHASATVSPALEFDVDCNELPPGLHTLFYRVKDSQGKYSSLHAFGFIKPDRIKRGTKVESIHYWWDDSIVDSRSVPYSSEQIILSNPNLRPGLHTLKYRLLDDVGKYSATFIHSFMKLAPERVATAVDSIQYWWDDRAQEASIALYMNEELMLPTNDLRAGLHSLNYRLKDDAGRWSASKAHYFYKGEQLDSARIVGYSYWWNDMAEVQKTVTLEEPAASFVLDEDLTVPEEARTGYAGHYTATLNLVITDNHGRTQYLSSNVRYTDNDVPSTDIDADRYVASDLVNISWTELSGDEMGDYNVYVSVDNGPFMLWLPDTKLTTAAFRGERGHSYLFTVTGRDSSGNREAYDETKCVSVAFE